MAVTYGNSADTAESGADDQQREDLTDLITNLSPTETPFFMMAGRGSCSAVKHEWLMDELAAASDNAQIEGLDQTGTITASVPAERLANFTQIWSKSISVTGTMEVVNKAGRNSELSYQLAKKSKELKRDMEFTHVGQTTVANMLSASGATRRSAAVQAHFHANWVIGGTALKGINISRGTSPGADGGFNTSTDIFAIPVDGVQRPLLESDLKGVIQGVWHNGGDPTVIMVGPFNKTTISSFTGNSTRFDRGEDKRLVASIDIYTSDFGDHKIIPNRFQRERDCFVFTPELFTMVYLRPFRQNALSKIGDSEERTILCEATMKYANTAGSGIVADLTTS